MVERVMRFRPDDGAWFLTMGWRSGRLGELLDSLRTKASVRRSVRAMGEIGGMRTKASVRRGVRAMGELGGRPAGVIVALVEIGGRA